MCKAAMNIFGEQVTVVANDNKEMIDVYYRAYHMVMAASSIEQASNPLKLFLEHGFGDTHKKKVCLGTAKNIMDLIAGVNTKWYVLINDNDEYFDGKSAFSSNGIYSNDQVFSEHSLPYTEEKIFNSSMQKVFVGSGMKTDYILAGEVAAIYIAQRYHDRNKKVG